MRRIELDEPLPIPPTLSIPVETFGLPCPSYPFKINANGKYLTQSSTTWLYTTQRATSIDIGREPQPPKIDDLPFLVKKPCVEERAENPFPADPTDLHLEPCLPSTTSESIATTPPSAAAPCRVENEMNVPLAETTRMPSPFTTLTPTLSLPPTPTAGILSDDDDDAISLGEDPSDFDLTNLCRHLHSLRLKQVE
ncbi:hypothetical protein BDN72DRAFT_320209 [Pluteus cervinus]|uniref:Uncharacterized protein n=1 Tax=Pluteus cervinus TaxID=181527 RepID=A0ACD3AF72_9AGAR|nr:hypothetical protein BDN72DRAFT_320209 [Pluteus cervinus]